jgi:hypothetical protein
MCYAFAFKIILLFIVQLKACGKVAVYGDADLCKLDKDNLLVGVKLKHDVMEQDFQHCTIIKLLSCTFGYAYLSHVK